jgi:hypothetical protein
MLLGLPPDLASAPLQPEIYVPSDDTLAAIASKHMTLLPL